MAYSLNFSRPFWLKRKDGTLHVCKCIGPFESGDDARRWLLRYRAVLDAANAGYAALEVLSDPSEM